MVVACIVTAYTHTHGSRMLVAGQFRVDGNLRIIHGAKTRGWGTRGNGLWPTDDARPVVDAG